MRQDRRVARRRLLPLAAAVAALGLLSPFALPAATAAELQPDADREARAAWRALPSSSNSCRDVYDYFPDSGLVAFYCHAQSLLTLERLERLAGMPSMRAPRGDALPSPIARAFRNYDPRFVKWLRGALLPARTDARFREETQPIYDRYVAPLARRWLSARRLMKARQAWTDVEVRWVRENLERGTLPERYWVRRYDHFDAPVSSGKATLLALDRSGWDANVGPTAVAFWIRRELDGSAPAFSAALEELVSLYDQEWIRAGAGIVKASPQPDHGGAEDAVPEDPDARACGEVREQLAAPPYVFLRLHGERGEEWVAVAARRFRKGERVCVGELRTVDDFRSTSLRRTFARVRFGEVLAPAMQEAEAGATDDSITIARLWRERKRLSGRTVSVTGTVVKYTANLLGTNWVHLSDGSGSRATRDDDLIVTTGGTAAVGDVVTVAGKVSVERDFGSGYAYPVMLEDAQLIPAGPPAPPGPPSEMNEAAAKQAAARRAGVPEEAVVAEGLGVRITAADFEAHLAEQSPFVRSRYGPLERKLEFLDGLIRFELLAAEARRRGLERGPDGAEVSKKLMVKELTKRSFATGDAPATSESELRELYERSRDEYIRPERLHVEVFQLEAPRAADQRKFVAASAERLRARLVSALPLENGDANDVATLGGSAGYKRLDLGFQPNEELASRYGERLAAVAAALAKPGDVGQVVETPDSFFVARLIGWQPALARTFEQVRDQLGARVAREAKAREFEALVGRLRTEAGIRIDERALDRIVLK